MNYIQAIIVVVGDMNPAIYSPAWLRRYRIAEEAEIAASENENKGNLVIAGAVDLAQIHCKSFMLGCERERFSCTVQDPQKFELLEEVVSRIFLQLKHTPVRAVGINFHADLPMQPDRPDAALRELFAARPDRLDTLFPEGWGLTAKVTSRGRWPRHQVTLSRQEGAVRLASNFHYEGDQLSSGEHVQGLVQERFGADRVAFERFAQELFQA